MVLVLVLVLVIVVLVEDVFRLVLVVLVVLLTLLSFSSSSAILVEVLELVSTLDGDTGPPKHCKRRRQLLHAGKKLRTHRKTLKAHPSKQAYWGLAHPKAGAVMAGELLETGKTTNKYLPVSAKHGKPATRLLN